MIQHVFAEIALAAVGARGGVAAQDVAIPAAGDIFARADRDIVGAADRVVVAACVDHGWPPSLEAACEQRGDEYERDEQLCGVRSHAPISMVVSTFVLGGLDGAIHQNKGNCR